MTISSNSAKLLAVSAAALMHGAAVWWLADGTEVEIEGGARMAEVSLGTSFADMAEGTMTPVETPDVTEPADTPKTTQSVKTPQAAEPVERATFTQAPTPETVTADAAQPNAQPPEAAEPLKPATSPSTPALTPQVTETPLVQVLPKAASPTPSETQEANDSHPTAVARSVRPKTRSPSFEKKHTVKPEPVKRETKAKPRKAVKQAKGNAKLNAKAGATTGTTKTRSKAVSSGQGRKKQANGNAAAGNYPSKVMRKIARVRKPRVGQKGAAVVTFTVASDGRLGSVSLARSSGSGQVDKAALNVVRKAAPFPPPPSGARRSFSIKIKGG